MEHVALHPALVHFPITFLVAALVLDVAGFAGGRPALAAMGRWALWLGTGSAALALWSGHHAGESVAGGLAPSVERLMLTHHDFALWTVGCAAALSLWRLVVREGAGFRWRLAYLLASALLVAQLTRTAHLGARLVFEHAVGVHAG